MTNLLCQGIAACFSSQETPAPPMRHCKMAGEVELARLKQCSRDIQPRCRTKVGPPRGLSCPTHCRPASVHSFPDKLPGHTLRTHADSHSVECKHSCRSQVEKPARGPSAFVRGLLKWSAAHAGACSCTKTAYQPCRSDTCRHHKLNSSASCWALGRGLPPRSLSLLCVLARQQTFRHATHPASLISVGKGFHMAHKPTAVCWCCSKARDCLVRNQ